MTLKLRLILAVSLLGAVVLGMFLATWTSTDSLQADALVVNLAGRQRMLTQRMAKDALLSALSGGGADNAAMKSLRDGADLFQSTMTILEKGGAAPVNGDPKGPKVAVPPASAEAAALLGSAFSKWKEFHELTTQVAGGKTPEQAGRVAALAEETVAAMSKAVLRFQAESEGKIATLLRVQVAGVFMALLALGGFVYILRNQLMLPLRRLVEYASRVERGDDAVQLQGEFSQELDVLARGVRSMVATMRETLTSCQGKELEAQTQAEAARVAEREASARDEALGQILAAMRAASSSAEDLSAKVSRAIEELSSEIDTVDKGVVIQRDRMTETAAAVEEMNATVMEVARNASNAAGNASDSRRLAAEGADGVGRAVTGIRQMESRILGLKETMARLGVEAENIGRIMNVISDIADQTNLLALNAAIEAARAGDAGRGFAVVADEVRKLAEKTMQATREVGSAIGAIQETTRQNVAAVEHAAQDIVVATGEANAAGERMSSIVTIVEQTAGQVESIAAAAEEQSAASEEINQAVSQVTRVATETAENMTRSAGALTRIISLVEDLNGVVRDLSRNNAADARAGAAHAAFSQPAVGDSRRLLEWNDQLSVNINSIDDEHRVLVNLMNELHAAMRDNKDRRVMGEILDRLKDYAVNHFETEERHFEKHNYPDRDAHIAQHQAFVGKVLEFYREFKSGRATVTLDLMKFLKDWLQTHIMTVDKKYSPYLKQKGVR